MADQPEKEVRFAVVMYGGVSLAIYINGVAQELYKMVRATARKRNADGTFGGYVVGKPKGTEVVYRQLGERLHARLIVDILSGTSAGGINAIFLAKALAMNQPMAQLEALWIDKGDIEVLINDKLSVQGIGALRYEPPPSSLLNSRRMYHELLSAFNGMDQASENGQAASSLVDELDLYVTATDLRGLLVPIPLADGEAHEYRYRTVFRFSHATEAADREPSQDFVGDNNPFLAFAARSTSSFPFAFEPIKIEDVGAALGEVPYKERAGKWERFYRDYQGHAGDSFESHSFGDGGYLDNKPFSYITDTLMRRRSDTPVDRRLFYIEPAPEHPEASRNGRSGRPNAIENVAAALVNLPRYETIREDLLQIKARNELIERTQDMLLKIERSRGGTDELNKWLSSGLQWSDQYLDHMIAQYGFGYAAYHQLRVADTLDDLAETLARNIGLEENSQAFRSLRQLLEEWRRRNYSANSQEMPRLSSENDLLFRLDLRWRLRRLYFVVHSIDDILLGIKNFRTDLSNRQLSAQDTEHGQQALQLVGKSGGRWEIPDEQMEQHYVAALCWVKRQLNQAIAALRNRRRQLRGRGLASEEGFRAADLASYRAALQPCRQMEQATLVDILHNEDRLRSACQDIEAVSLALASREMDPGESSAGYVRQTLTDVSKMCQQALAIRDFSGAIPSSGEPQPDVPEPALQAVRDCLSFYYNYFDYFDLLTFPITYATPIGESDVVEVFRISPEDARSLFDPQQSGHPKLAGTKLGNFGAFLKREWRQNDILWGKLDGAERIITTLLPDSAERSELLLQAWMTILKESPFQEHWQKLSGSLGETVGTYFDRNGKLPPYDANNPDDPQHPKNMIVKMRKYFSETPLVDFEFSRDVAMKSLGRSLQVVGGVLDGMVEQYRGLQSPAIWLARIGQIVMGVLQVAVPDSLPRWFFKHWIKIAYLFEFFLIGAGLLLDVSGAIVRFGVVSLLATIGVDLAVRFAEGFITGSTRFARALRWLVRGATALLLIATLILVYFGLVFLGLRDEPVIWTRYLSQWFKPGP